MSNIFSRELLVFDQLGVAIDTAIRSTVEENKFQLKEYNLESLRDHGEKADGEKLRPGYSSPYKRRRVKRGLQVSYVDLKFTGKFYGQIEIIAEPDQIKISSKIDYGEHVIKRYGKEVLGIQEQYLEEFTFDILLPEIKQAFNDKFTRS